MCVNLCMSHKTLIAPFVYKVSVEVFLPECVWISTLGDTSSSWLQLTLPISLSFVVSVPRIVQMGIREHTIYTFRQITISFFRSFTLSSLHAAGEPAVSAVVVKNCIAAFDFFFFFLRMISFLLASWGHELRCAAECEARWVSVAVTKRWIALLFFRPETELLPKVKEEKCLRDFSHKWKLFWLSVLS